MDRLRASLEELNMMIDDLESAIAQHEDRQHQELAAASELSAQAAKVRESRFVEQEAINQEIAAKLDQTITRLESVLGA